MDLMDGSALFRSKLYKVPQPSKIGPLREDSSWKLKHKLVTYRSCFQGVLSPDLLKDGAGGKPPSEVTDCDFKDLSSHTFLISFFPPSAGGSVPFLMVSVRLTALLALHFTPEPLCGGGI